MPCKSKPKGHANTKGLVARAHEANLQNYAADTNILVMGGHKLIEVCLDISMAPNHNQQSVTAGEAGKSRFLDQTGRVSVLLTMKNKFPLITAFALVLSQVFSLSWTARQNEPGTKTLCVFIFAGQSNMVGSESKSNSERRELI